MSLLRNEIRFFSALTERERERGRHWSSIAAGRSGINRISVDRIEQKKISWESDDREWDTRYSSQLTPISDPRREQISNNDTTDRSKCNPELNDEHWGWRKSDQYHQMVNKEVAQTQRGTSSFTIDAGIVHARQAAFETRIRVWRRWL